MKRIARWIATFVVMSLVACQPKQPAPTSLPTFTPAPSLTATLTPLPASTAVPSPTTTSIPSPSPAPAATETASGKTARTSVSTLLSIAWDDRSPFRSGLIRSEQAVLQQLDGASVYHMDLQIADDLIHLDGQLEVRYSNQETEPLNEVYFRLFPNLFGGATEITAVDVGGEAVTPTYELADSAMRVALSPPLQPGEEVVIAITFSVLVPTEAGGNYGTFAFVEDVLSLAHFYPLIPVYDDEGWNVEIPPEHGDVVYADSSFYLVRVSAPKALTIVASGVEVERQMAGGGQQVTYAGGPMRDFYLVVSPRYTVVSEQVGETTVNSYAPAELAEGARTALRYTVDALRSFGERFGLYPFTEFDVVSTATSAFGVEYPGIVAMAMRLYPPQTEYPPAYLESTMAHEVSHQWFYSVVGNDQLDEPWLDEAFAQYSTLLYWQDLYGPPGAEGFRASLLERWAGVDNADIPIGMPVRAYEGKEYGAIVYGRGPLFLEALRNTMGQPTFDAFLHDYYETFKWGIATTEGLKQLAESHCNCDLTPLFVEWVYER